MSILFIADLHLKEKRPDITEKFLLFILERARLADALYILGDLFSAWIGIDHEPALNHAVIDALRHLVKSGVPVYLQYGNRDFLLTQKFCQKAYCRLLPDPIVMDIYHVPVLISHGDILCSKDLEYQKIRRRTRRKFLQKIFLMLPLKQRQKILKAFQNNNQHSKPQKTPEMMDADQDTITEWIQEHEVHYLIHGHTHKPAIHKLEINGHTVTRVVLGAWKKQAHILSCTPGKTPDSLTFEFIQF